MLTYPHSNRHAQPAHPWLKHQNMVNTQGMLVAVLFKNSTNEVKMAFSFQIFKYILPSTNTGNTGNSFGTKGTQLPVIQEREIKRINRKC